ncbi:Fur-regulated basic protein FbpA [Sutcliffiella horikoshii]|uniref:Fur-regulated basic protein FbpA n=1 Tax=Sutcliffiella horikoshii TaxID=79883 RepID=UPI00204142D1|nr:Fur-regulated basic protein FbpA [Sutcliffiella horikoshii]MCM3619192.1 Fur-regulated basic protein FbpA [Sutcliffiella horikoshii]
MQGKIEKMPLTQLRRGVEARMDYLKSELIKMAYFKTPDGVQLYELTLTELEQIWENVRTRQAEKRKGVI